jgi:glycerate-2-kinase
MAKNIFQTALDSVLSKNFMHRSCVLDSDTLSINNNRYELRDFKNLYIFGSGKASYSMAQEMESILGERIYKGLIISPYDKGELKHIDVRTGSHPIPSQDSIEATKALLEMMRGCDEDDLYIFLLSGGSSALMELPIEPISIDELSSATKLMLGEDMCIDEINVVRKHLSQIKGGKLAQQCKAKGIVLVISDVVGDPLESIASAPLYCDSSSYADAHNLLESKSIFEKLSASIQNTILDGMDQRLQETPKSALDRVEHYILASNHLAKKSAADYAKSIGLSVELVQKPMQGEVTYMVEEMLNMAQHSSKECLIFGGECTVDLDGDGIGGRNQHSVILMLKRLRELGLDYTYLCASTDGVDGNSDAAGAVIDAQTDTKGIESYIKHFDSYNFFKKNGSLIETGPTGTNVTDLAIILKGVKDV